MISRGTIHAYMHAHTNARRPLEERCKEEEGGVERQPRCETSVNKCAPGVRGQHTSIFSPASYSSQETFEAGGGLVWLCFRGRLVCLHIQYNTPVDALMLGRCY